MSSTKRTPDEPGRGTVATGPQAEPTGDNGSTAGAANGTGNGLAGEPSQPGAAEGGPPEAVTGSDIVAAGGTPASPPEEATTAQFTVPTTGSAPAAPATPGSVETGHPHTDGGH